MAGKDEWAPFENLLKYGPLQPKELAAELAKLDKASRGVNAAAASDFDDPVLLSNWRQGKKRPRFDDLPLISRALSPDGDPTYLARAMGMIPDVAGLGQRIIRLQTRVDGLAAREQELDLRVAEQRNAVVANIVQAATQTDRWAVAVWPAMEGPPDYRFHVSDRIDFAPIDGRTCASSEEVCDLLRHESEVMELLNIAHAVPSPRAHPRWKDLLRSEDAVPKVGSYSVSILSASFPPGTALLKQHRAVAVVALSVAAWAPDTAGFLARMLTYGLHSSRALCTETYGYRTQSDITDEERDRRRELHVQWLRSPQPRYVWTHFGREEPEALFPDPARWDDNLTCVWLRETDRLLDATAQSPEHADKWKSARDRVDEYVSETPDERLITLDVDYPDCPADEVRSRRMEQALLRAVDAIDAMVAAQQLERDTVAALMRKLDDDGRSSIAKTVYRWLSDTKRLIEPS